MHLSYRFKNTCISAATSSFVGNSFPNKFVWKNQVDNNLKEPNQDDTEDALEISPPDDSPWNPSRVHFPISQLLVDNFMDFRRLSSSAISRIPRTFLLNYCLNVCNVVIFCWVTWLSFTRDLSCIIVPSYVNAFPHNRLISAAHHILNPAKKSCLIFAVDIQNVLWWHEYLSY